VARLGRSEVKAPATGVLKGRQIGRKRRHDPSSNKPYPSRADGADRRRDGRDRGPVDLGTFECRDINRSTIIQRVCYDRAQRQMIVGIKGSYDQYCGLPVQTFDDFMSAPSMGQFFHQSIRGSAPDRRYDCRADRPPGY